MPENMFERKISVAFNPETSYNASGKHIRDGLSCALRTGNNFWFCCDERSSLERLTILEDGSLGKHKQFDLSAYLELPSATDCEIDIEGLGLDENYLWLTGSHSLARKKPRKKDSIEKQIKRLATVKEDPNRYILAKIPIVKDPETGDYELFKTTNSPRQANPFQASQLAFKGRRNRLMEVLEDDEHFKHFMKIPGKDNGFDIEGLAVDNDKIYIGVRGPVLRGWAVILELQFEEAAKGFFDLKPFQKGKYYKKHFLRLQGMGIRDLIILEKDMLILAGPTMDIDGTISVYRWKNALLAQSDTVVHRSEMQKLFDVPHGYGEKSGRDKAEGMALYDPNSLLIVFDSPTDERKAGESQVAADLFRIPGEHHIPEND
jgi:hypothetical protein